MIRFNEEIIKFMTVKYENKKEIAFWETLCDSVKKTNKTIEEKAETPETSAEEKKESKEA